jgi:hypothetical protein
MDRLEFFNKCLDTQYESLDQVNWNDRSLYTQPHSIGFLIEFANELNWDLVAEWTVIPQKYVMKFKNYMNWNKYITHHSPLPELMLEIVSKVDNIDWNIISEKCWLVHTFVKTYYNKLNKELFLNNNNVDNDVKMLYLSLLLENK